MSRYIDADALIAKMPTVMDMQDTYLPIHFKEWLIDTAPSIDIVRCKECKWGKPYSDKQLECDALGLGGLKFPNGFCSYGVKKGADDGTEMF